MENIISFLIMNPFIRRVARIVVSYHPGTEHTSAPLLSLWPVDFSTMKEMFLLIRDLLPYVKGNLAVNYL